jgi:hypothetical protein
MPSRTSNENIADKTINKPNNKQQTLDSLAPTFNNLTAHSVFPSAVNFFPSLISCFVNRLLDDRLLPLGLPPLIRLNIYLETFELESGMPTSESQNNTSDVIC